MKYTSEITINAPLETFIAKMDDADGMKHWQRGFVGYEFVEGEPGTPGAKMRMDYDNKGRKFSLLETVIIREFPDRFDATYEMPGMLNLQKNIFESTSDGNTKWISYSEFTTKKILYKIMFYLMPSLFKKQSQIIMEDLKAYVEDGTSVMQTQ